MFSLPENTMFIEVEYHYSIPLVLLSIVVIVVGTLTALICNVRIRENSFIGRNIWIFIATSALSISIWTMHFIGMQAIIIPEKVSYNYLLTAFSGVPIFVGLLVSFYVLNNFKKNWKIYYVASNVLAVGLLSMHYIGMDAMHYEMIGHVYNIPWFLASVVVAMIATFCGLYVFANTRLYRLDPKKRFIPAIILGLAFATVHYVGMEAVQYYRITDPTHINHVASNNLLRGALLDTIIVWNTIFIFALFLYVAYSNRYFESRLNYFDSLTNLPNLRMFHLQMDAQLKAHAVAILQLDELEEYKQEYGYLIADQLVQHIATIFKDFTSTMISVYRIEDHRFVFVALDQTASIDLEHNLYTIADLLKQSFVFEKRRISLKGMTAFVTNEQSDSLRKLYFDALSVINYPSLERQFDVTYFNTDYHERNFDEEITEDLHEALKNGAIYMVYQPKVNSDCTKIHSAEALIRWQHHKHGFLAPNVFLPILETNDLMSDLTDWIIEEVCRTLSHWRLHDMMPKQIAINIPGPYLTSDQLMKCLKEMTTKYMISPESIELEITETHYVKTIASAEKAVRNYRSEGFSVALDDFGTGVSSLSYLKKIPITTLKIDKSFIDGVPMSQKDSSIIKSIIQLGNSLNLKVVVEGVETVEQVQFLKDHCNAPQMQGYYFAKPMREEELMDWCKAFDVQMSV